jgi:hypothetical protein
MVTTASFAPGDRVLLVEFGPPFMTATVQRVCLGGVELEVIFPDPDGCGEAFDFWPVDSVRLDV